MSGKDAIIEKILNDTETRVNGILAEAEEKAQANEKRAEAEIADYTKRFEEATPAYMQEVLDRKRAVVKSDIKKYRLKLKQDLIADVFEQAKKRLLELDDGKYMSFMKSMLQRYAEGGEGVIASLNDKKRFTQAFLDKELPEKNLKIQGYGDFDGGFLLSSDKYDKTVTLDRILKGFREEKEADIAKLLFEAKE